DAGGARKLVAAATEAGVVRPYAQEWMLLETLEGRYEAALSRLDQMPADSLADPGRTGSWNTQFGYTPQEQWYATLQGLLGDTETARASWEAAAAHLESLLKERPEDSRLHSALGIAYAGLGRKADAIEEGKLGVALLPITREAYRGAFRVEDLARIYASVGEIDAAVDELEVLHERPGRMTVGRLRLEPWWKPLRGQPRFEALIAKYEPAAE
ncbi:MAG: BTAD domain-containing putative transcriptional regulator, partial [Gemmatimonadales bacterium]